MGWDRGCISSPGWLGYIEDIMLAGRSIGWVVKGKDRKGQDRTGQCEVLERKGSRVDWIGSSIEEDHWMNESTKKRCCRQPASRPGAREMEEMKGFKTGVIKSIAFRIEGPMT